MLRVGDLEDPIPDLLGRTTQVSLAGSPLEIVGREDFIALKAFAAGPVDLADARAVIAQGEGSLDLDLLRRLARRFGSATAHLVEDLIAGR